MAMIGGKTYVGDVDLTAAAATAAAGIETTRPTKATRVHAAVAAGAARTAVATTGRSGANESGFRFAVLQKVNASAVNHRLNQESDNIPRGHR